MYSGTILAVFEPHPNISRPLAGEESHQKAVEMDSAGWSRNCILQGTPGEGPSSIIVVEKQQQILSGL